ncbi:hypothetical protein SeMB42_g05905 [Synchytrium endobioticum]|uniref:Spindle pole body component n=1 Tax=Synchytrium endobioticum TaxID=286115 RepID=A0A507D233_9FUNG|nr:hypothetical protein SeMB42_g05905 [Synchytrium endobioticum]TPX45310.1 hypothetical protein SeLEV6574_g03945 [Synchytrium endobioticum]
MNELRNLTQGLAAALHPQSSSNTNNIDYSLRIAAKSPALGQPLPPSSESAIERYTGALIRSTSPSLAASRTRHLVHHLQSRHIPGLEPFLNLLLQLQASEQVVKDLIGPAGSGAEVHGQGDKLRLVATMDPHANASSYTRRGLSTSPTRHDMTPVGLRSMKPSYNPSISNTFTMKSNSTDSHYEYADSSTPVSSEIEIDDMPSKSTGRRTSDRGLSHLAKTPGSTSYATTLVDEDGIDLVKGHQPDPLEDKAFMSSAPLQSRLQQQKVVYTAMDPTMGRLPFEDQEALVIEDLLYVLMGIEGTYIRRRSDDSLLDSAERSYVESVQFEVDASLDVSLSEQVRRILVAASNYIGIDHFIAKRSKFEFGRVSHALCAAMRMLLKEYLVLIAQLEYQFRTAPSFGIQKLWYYVSPVLQTVSNIGSLCQAIRVAEAAGSKRVDATDGYRGQSKGGGRLLGIIADRMVAFSGDMASLALHAHLLSAAAVPYLATLRQWIYYGEIFDPYDEFMIIERKSVTKENIRDDFTDTYWERRYKFRQEAIPSFLSSLRDKVLLAGKYLNVIRECEIEIKLPSQVVDKNGELVKRVSAAHSGALCDVVKAVEGGRFVQDIELAYRAANRSLLDLLFKGEQLLPRLRSVKHYFLLDQSDFLIHFLDLALPELHLPTSESSIEKLRSLLELVIRNPASALAHHPYKEDMSVELSTSTIWDLLIKINLVKVETIIVKKSGGVGDESVDSELEALMAPATNPLTGIEALSFTYAVNFPLSLILNKRTLLRYQILFRHLLLCKHAEKLLCGSWIDLSRLSSATLRSRASSISASKIPRNSLPPRSASASTSDVIGAVTTLPQSRDYDDGSGEDQQQAIKDNALSVASRVSALRMKMLAFVQQFLYYATYEVLEPNWAKMEEELAKVTTVEEVLQIHEAFLERCLKECMLSNGPLIMIFTAMLQICVQFSKSTADAARHGPSQVHFHDIMSGYENSFTTLLYRLIAQLQFERQG